jgi:hypothetical protein
MVPKNKHDKRQQTTKPGESKKEMKLKKIDGIPQRITKIRQINEKDITVWELEYNGLKTLDTDIAELLPLPLKTLRVVLRRDGEDLEKMNLFVADVLLRVEIGINNKNKIFRKDGKIVWCGEIMERAEVSRKAARRRVQDWLSGGVTYQQLYLKAVPYALLGRERKGASIAKYHAAKAEKKQEKKKTAEDEAWACLSGEPRVAPKGFFTPGSWERKHLAHAGEDKYGGPKEKTLARMPCGY